MAKIKIRKGDIVRVIAGKDKGKEGKVLVVDRKHNRVVVEGVNMIKKHSKPSPMQQGGIVQKEGSIHVSNVMYVHNGKPTRLGIKVVMEEEDGRSKAVRYRIAKSTGEVID